MTLRTASRRFSVKFAGFALAPLLALTLAAEITVRVKYYVHNRDWVYLTTPFFRSRFNPTATPTELPRMPQGSGRANAQGSGGTNAQGPGAASAQGSGQMVVAWDTPCTNSMVYSAERRRTLPRTYDVNCFRGDHVTEDKAPGEYRIVFLGGSTVEDRQSDDEMMTAQFKNALDPELRGRTSVVNAGHAAYDSLRILRLYETRVSRLKPDVVFYYEAWNEQPVEDRTFRRAEQALIERLGSGFHRALYYNSLLYTYLVEKYELAASGKIEIALLKARFWKIDVAPLREHFTALARRAGADGARFVFVTQVLNWPRMWKGVDTFDYQAVGGLLDRLKADREYTYAFQEISALNQRLAVAYTIGRWRELGVPVINILEPVEALGEPDRAAMFFDLGHRTVRGDDVVGRLIAERFRALR